MRTLVEALREHLGYQINENFESEILRTTFIDNPTNKQIFKSYGGLAKELKWDVITDADIAKVDTEQAGKLAYQRKDIPAYILWFDGDDRLLARTISSDIILPGYRGSWKNTRKIQQAAAYAIVIKDYEKFDTTQLKRDRAEAKKGALAFMTDKQILKKNLARYEEKLKELKANGFHAENYVEDIKSVITKLGGLINAIPTDFVPDNWNTFARNFELLSQRARQIFDHMDGAIRNKDYAERDKANGGDGDYYNEELVRNIKEFDEYFNKFCVMYDLAIEGKKLSWM